jgi:DNA-binding transcriptional LysR family regulator
MRFDLVDLQLFLHVAEAASITRGAELSNMALASASERIRKMEELAGVELLERRRRGVNLTAAGRSFVHHARLVLQQIDHMKGELSEFAGGTKGRVRLQANASALSEFLAPSKRSLPLIQASTSMSRRTQATRSSGLWPKGSLRLGSSPMVGETAAIRVARLADPWALRELHVCVRRSGDLAPPARLLLEHLRSAAQDCAK